MEPGAVPDNEFRPDTERPPEPDPDVLDGLRFFCSLDEKLSAGLDAPNDNLKPEQSDLPEA